MTDAMLAAAKTIAETPFPAAETMRCPYPLYEALRSGPPTSCRPASSWSRGTPTSRRHARPEAFSSHHSVFEDGWMRAATLEDHLDPHAIWG